MSKPVLSIRVTLDERDHPLTIRRRVAECLREHAKTLEDTSRATGNAIAGSQATKYGDVTWAMEFSDDKDAA